MKTLLLSVLLAACALSTGAQELVYRSNSFGMLLERIEPYLRDQSEWIMGISRTGSAEVRRLYSRGKEVRRWEVSGNADGTQRVEREMAHDVLAAKRTYDGAGDLLLEEEYSAGRVTQESLYTWRGTRLVKMRLQKADGSLMYTERYVYGTSGALREVRRTEAGSGVRFSAYVFGPAGLSEERNAIRELTFIARYDTNGRLASREQRRGDTLISREDFTYRADSDHLLSSVERLPDRNEQVERRYDDQGRIAAETRRSAGETTEEIGYTRDGKGRLVEKGRRTPTGLETWKYTLDADGRTTREEFLRRGILARVTIFGEGNMRTEDFYRDDSVFLKVYYDGDKRLREDVFEGGKLVRERHYN